MAEPPDARNLGAEATAFVQKRLRMQDVREYLLDALGTYASLQRFTPRRALAGKAIGSLSVSTLRNCLPLPQRWSLPRVLCFDTCKAPFRPGHAAHRPSSGAQLVTAEVVLQHYLFDTDRALILRAHPWLRCQHQRGL